MPYIRIKKCINCGIAHEWLFTQPTLKELREIKHLTGMGASQFGEAGDQGDPDALTALVVILHKRDKINLAFDDADLDFSDFEMEATETEKAEQADLEQRMEKAARTGMSTGQTPKAASGRRPKAG